MPGKRQPTDLIKANGRKHLSVAEENERRSHEVRIDPPEQVTPPKWLPARQRKEFREIGELLRRSGLYTELDRDTLAQYFAARDRWLAAYREASAAIDAGDAKLAKDWTNIQNTYFRQARQCADVMGLSVSSRCRLALPKAVEDAADEAEDEFTKRLSERQQRAGTG